MFSLLQRKFLETRSGEWSLIWEQSLQQPEDIQSILNGDKMTQKFQVQFRREIKIKLTIMTTISTRIKFKLL